MKMYPIVVTKFANYAGCDWERGGVSAKAAKGGIPFPANRPSDLIRRSCFFIQGEAFFILASGPSFLLGLEESNRE
jgi:hypothetical protein